MAPLRPLMLACVLVAGTAGEGLADPEAEAAARIQSAQQHHGAGRYAEALADLTAAHELDPQPKLLYAIAQVQVKLDRCGDAIENYEKFLASDPDAGPAAAAREAIAVCKQKLPAEPPPPAPAPVPAPVAEPTPLPAPVPQRDEPRPWFKDRLGGALVGAGLIAGVGGLVMFVSATGDLDDAEAAATYEESEELVDRAGTKRTRAVVIGGAGAVLIGAGVVRYLMVRGDDAGSGIAVVPTRDGGAITWSGRF